MDNIINFLLTILIFYIIYSLINFYLNYKENSLNLRLEIYIDSLIYAVNEELKDKDCEVIKLIYENEINNLNKIRKGEKL